MHLLDLPAELRNRIYECALTESPPELQYMEDKIDDTRWKPVLIASYQESCNALKYTCRQLYAETAGLELKYNTIILQQQDCDDLSPSRKLHRFSDRVSDHECRQMRTLVLRTAPAAQTEPYRHFVDLARWCATKPQVTVKYVFANFCFAIPPDLPEDVRNWGSQDVASSVRAASDFLLTGVYHMIALRGHRWSASEWSRLGFHAVMEVSQEVIADVAERLEGSGSPEHMDVPGLRFYPDEKVINPAMKEAVRLSAVRNGVGAEVKEEWVTMFEKWVSEGI